MQTAYFAGGCFWCITPTFQEFPGVASVTSGYSGGAEVNPTYEDVKYQRTGHRETISIIYDENQVTYGQLLEIFLSGVDPFGLTGAIPTPLLFFIPIRKKSNWRRKPSMHWRQKAAKRYTSAWNPSRLSIQPRKNTRITIASIRRNSARN